VFRPADGNEVKAAWKIALLSKTPVALILTRQGVPTLDNSSFENAQKGAYIIKEASSPSIDHCIIATGSEVALALTVADTLESQGQTARVVSMPSMELFDAQSPEYRASVIPDTAKRLSVIEAQSSFGWHKYVGKDGMTFTVDSFGLSAPESDLRKHFGFLPESIVKTLQESLLCL
jgi:transketolase